MKKPEIYLLRGRVVLGLLFFFLTKTKKRWCCVIQPPPGFDVFCFVLFFVVVFLKMAKIIQTFSVPAPKGKLKNTGNYLAHFKPLANGKYSGLRLVWDDDYT